MSRETSEARTCFKSICRSRHVEENTILKRTRLFLKCYRKICWSSAERFNVLIDDTGSYCYHYDDLSYGLDYLEDFDPVKDKDLFEERIRTLFETKAIIGLVDTAMIKVREFPGHGNIYFSIINDYYLSATKNTETDMLDMLGLERSMYYERKKEAVMVFAIAFWNNAIPKMKALLTDPEYDEQSYQDDGFKGENVYG